MDNTSEQEQWKARQRPVADQEAFIQDSDTQQYFQHNLNPLDRAKELAAEMKSTREERRKSMGEKFFKIGGGKV
jgi:heme oxygenase